MGVACADSTPEGLRPSQYSERGGDPVYDSQPAGFTSSQPSPVSTAAAATYLGSGAEHTAIFRRDSQFVHVGQDAELVVQATETERMAHFYRRVSSQWAVNYRLPCAPLFTRHVVVGHRSAPGEFCSSLQRGRS